MAQLLKRQDVAPTSFRFEFLSHGCPCGFHTDPKNECHCTSRMISNYMARISGPLLDRIDIQIEMPPVDPKVLRKQATGRSSADIRVEVAAARRLQTERFAGTPIRVNARMSHKDAAKYCRLDAAGESIMDAALHQMSLNARAHDEIVKVARTIADLAASPDVLAEHLAEAVNYRSLDRQLWA